MSYISRHVDPVNLMQGDCLERMKEIPAGSVDMILCDLPYGTTACKWDVVIPFEPLWDQYDRVIKKNGAIVLTASQPFTSALIMSRIALFRYEWIWGKTYATGFANANKMPLKSHENVCVFYAALPTYNPQGLEPFGKPVKRGAAGGIMGKTAVTVGSASVQAFTGYPRSSIVFGKEKTFHPTGKPVALMEYLVKTYTNPGETVLDNCMGSGTTGVACVNEDRRFIGIERDPDYFRIASDRIAEATKRREAETEAFLAELVS